MAGEVWVTLTGSLAEVDQGAGVATTLYGVLAELGVDTINVTLLGVLVEIEEAEAVATTVATYFTGKTKHVQLPDPTTGYQLDEDYSFWSVVVPVVNKNRYINPSAESLISPLTLTNWTADLTFASEEKSSEKASRGFHSVKYVTGGANSDIRVDFYQPEVGWRVVSVDIDHDINQRFSLRVTGSVGSPQYAYREIVPQKTGWARYSLRVYLPGSFTNEFRAIIRSYSTNTGSFYVDGWMISDFDGEYTYFDGDSTENAFDSNSYAFTWQGSPHISISSASDRVHTAGEIVSLESLGFKTTAIVGLGMIDPELDLVTLTGGEELSKGSIAHGKDFSIVGRIYAASFRELTRKRQDLIGYLNFLNSHSGLLTLGYQTLDGLRLWMTCSFAGGLSGNVTNLYQDSLELRFRLLNGKVYEEFGSVAVLDFSDYSNNTHIFIRDPNTGQWQDLFVSAAANGAINCTIVLNNGFVIVGGAFTTIGGITARRIAAYDPYTQTWNEPGDGFNGEVTILTKGSGNFIYSGVIPSFAVGGSFTANGPGTVTMIRTAYFDGDDFNIAVGTGTFAQLADGLNNTVHDIKSAPDGTLYAVGAFTQTAGASLARSFVRFKKGVDAQWNNLIGTSITGGVPLSLEIVPDYSKVYLGGSFTAIDGNNGLACIAQYNVTAATWTALEAGLAAQVRDLQIAPDGYLYAVGDFVVTAGGAARTMRRITRWTGSSFEEVGNGEINVAMHRIAFDRRGNMFVAGTQNEDGNYTSTSETVLFQWNGAAWVSPDFRATNPTLGQIFVAPDGSLVVSAATSANVVLAGYTEVVCAGTADTPVRFTMIGPGILHRISSWTLDAHIYFHSLTLEVGEQFFLDLTGSAPRAWTNFRPNVLDQIVLGASDPLYLLPGSNHLTVTVSGATDSDTKCVLAWQNHHWSIDGSVS